AVTDSCSTGFQPVPGCANRAAQHGLETRATTDTNGCGSIPGQVTKNAAAARNVRRSWGTEFHVTILHASQTMNARSHITAHAGRSMLSVISVFTEISPQKNLSLKSCTR